MTIQEKIEKLAKQKRRKIGVGYLRDVPEVIESLRRAQEFADIIIIGKKIEGFSHIAANQTNLEKICVEAYKQNKIEGLLRGHGDASTLRDVICREYGYKLNDIIELALISDITGHSFLFGPVSQAQGWPKNQKLEAIRAMSEVTKNFSIDSKVALLTAVRTGSRGRNFFLDLSYEIADDCVEWCRQNGIDAKNYNIELETALKEKCNIIIPPNGVAGNHAIRAITCIAGKPAYTYLVLGIKENITENMRNETDWTNFVRYLVARANSDLFS